MGSRSDVSVRAKCQMKNCLYSDGYSKVCEEFEALIHNVCWSCGDKIKDKLTYEQIETFLKVIRVIEEELE